MPEYRTPGIYIEEVSGGPRPVQASSTTDTGFVAMLTLPTSFLAGRGAATGLWLPGPEEAPLLAWNRALAFRSLPAPAAEPAPRPTSRRGAAAAEGATEAAPAAAAAPPAAPASDGNRFQKLVSEMLPGRWTIKPPVGDSVIVMTSDGGDTLRVPVSRTLMSEITVKDQKVWEMAWGADEQKVLELFSGYAVQNQVRHSGNLACVDPSGAPVTIDLAEIHDRLAGPAPAVTGMTGYHAWRTQFGESLFIELAQTAGGLNQTRSQAMWDTLPSDARKAWDQWLRAHPGMRRLELALQGFFENGGTRAYIAMGVMADGAAGPAKRAFLEASFDKVSSVAMVAAPGLDFGWQQSILEYAGIAGRGDLFAVLETPRPFRWTEGSTPYEVSILETVESSQCAELRFLGYSADEVLDRVVPRDENGYGAAYGPWLIVDNPLSVGPADRYVIAPPSGHVAGVIARTDLRAGGGVHKAPANEQLLGCADLVTEISDREQGPINVKGINIIRHRSGGGMRVWGARTTGGDPLWRYVNVRRLFLMVERSVRDAVNWAVFLPNTDRTRRDLATTIRSFLYSLWNQGMLDGATHQQAYTVKCDKENNPDIDVRSGMLTVDVEFRPPYPAEFVRIRFRQAPMEVPE